MHVKTSRQRLKLIARLQDLYASMKVLSQLVRLDVPEDAEYFKAMRRFQNLKRQTDDYATAPEEVPE